MMYYKIQKGVAQLDLLPDLFRSFNDSAAKDQLH